MARPALPADWLVDRNTDVQQANDVMAIPNNQKRKNCSMTLLAMNMGSCKAAPAGTSKKLAVAAG